MGLKITSLGYIGRYKRQLLLKFSNGESLKLSPELALEVSLFEGRELTAQEFTELLQKQQRAEAYNSALRILSRRSHSRGELGDKLKIREFPSKIIEETIQRLSAEDYLDDEQFAVDYVKSRVVNKPRGRMLIKKELLGKKVSRETIERIMSEYYPESMEMELAREILSKNSNRFSSITGAELKSKLHSFLKNRGFSFETINSLINEYILERK
ncbi:MAG: hypothetical protein GF315_00340 [candidate division Zixibacteria bacterium]|nr:hypothetical protein [candidate division Zixibacteria bacterium]